MPAPERQGFRETFHLRMGQDLRQQVQALANRDGRTQTAEIIFLVERGLDMDSLTRGPLRDLALDLILAARMATDAGPLMLVEAMMKHFEKADLVEALDHVSARLKASSQ